MQNIDESLIEFMGDVGNYGGNDLDQSQATVMHHHWRMEIGVQVNYV